MDNMYFIHFFMDNLRWINFRKLQKMDKLKMDKILDFVKNG